MSHEERSAQFEGGLFAHLGFELAEAGPDEVAITWTIGPQHLQPYGIVHGGVYCAVVETAASFGAALWLGERGRVVGVSNTTEFLHGVGEGTLRATGRPIERTLDGQLWQVDIHDERQRLIACGQVRLQTLRARHDADSGARL